VHPAIINFLKLIFRGGFGLTNLFCIMVALYQSPAIINKIYQTINKGRSVAHGYKTGLCQTLRGFKCSPTSGHSNIIKSMRKQSITSYHWIVRIFTFFSRSYKTVYEFCLFVSLCYLLTHAHKYWNNKTK